MSDGRPSRSLRKRQSAVSYQDPDDSDLEDILEEHELEGIEVRAERDAKKFRLNPEELEQFKAYTIPFVHLPPLCLERIMSYVQDPKDLFSLTFCAQSLSNLLTPEVVIRIAVFHNFRKGKNQTASRRIMSGIMNHITNRAIHLPNAHRMLRLLNAKCCERGELCWGRNLNTGRSMTLRGGVQRPFGMALCDKCQKHGTVKVGYGHFGRNEKGVAFHNGNTLCDPHRETVTGETVGPLISVLSLQQIDSSFRNREDKKIALEGYLQRALSEESTLCPNHYEEKAAAYQELFENTEKEADGILLADANKSAEEYRERREERIQKRMTKIRQIYEKLQIVLDDCPLKELALAHTWLEDNERCIRFKAQIVEDKMRHLVNAPSTASDRAIAATGESIKTVFISLQEKNFFQFSYIESSSNRFKKGIYKFCRDETTPEKILRSSLCGDINFMSALNEDRPIRALVRALSRMDGALSRCFALSVVRVDPERSEAEELVSQYRNLAEVVWRKKVTHLHMNVSSFTQIKASFNTSVEEFRTMKRNARDYLNHDDTRSFLQRNNTVGGRADFTRQEALDQVFKPKTHRTWFGGQTQSAYEYLRQRNFNQLRILHESYFRRPNSYNL